MQPNLPVKQVYDHLYALVKLIRDADNQYVKQTDLTPPRWDDMNIINKALFAQDAQLVISSAEPKWALQTHPNPKGNIARYKQSLTRSTALELLLLLIDMYGVKALVELESLKAQSTTKVVASDPPTPKPAIKDSPQTSKSSRKSKPAKRAYEQLDITDEIPF